MANNKTPSSNYMNGFHSGLPNFSAERSFNPNVYNPRDPYGIFQRNYQPHLNQNIRSQLHFNSYSYRPNIQEQLYYPQQNRRNLVPNIAPNYSSYSVSKPNLSFKKHSQQKKSKRQIICISDDQDFAMIPQTQQIQKNINQLKPIQKIHNIPTSDFQQFKQPKDLNELANCKKTQILNQNVEKNDQLNCYQKQKQNVVQNINQVNNVTQYQNNQEIQQILKKRQNTNNLYLSQMKKIYNNRTQNPSIYSNSQFVYPSIKKMPENSNNIDHNFNKNIVIDLDDLENEANNLNSNSKLPQNSFNYNLYNPSHSNPQINSISNIKAVSNQLQPNMFQQYRRYREYLNVQPNYRVFQDNFIGKKADQPQQQKIQRLQQEKPIKKSVDSTFDSCNSSNTLKYSPYISNNLRNPFYTIYPPVPSNRYLLDGYENQNRLNYNREYLSSQNQKKLYQNNSNNNSFYRDKYNYPLLMGRQNLKTFNIRDDLAYKYRLQQLKKQQYNFLQRQRFQQKNNSSFAKYKQTIYYKKNNFQKNQQPIQVSEGTSLELIAQDKEKNGKTIQQQQKKYTFNKERPKMIKKQNRKKDKLAQQGVISNDLPKTKKIRKLRSDKADQNKEKQSFNHQSGLQDNLQQTDCWTQHHKKIKQAVKKREFTTQMLTGFFFQADIPQFQGFHPSLNYRKQRINKKNDLLNRNFNPWV